MRPLENGNNGNQFMSDASNMPYKPNPPGRVFILGAGFSAEAGIPLTASLLKETMKTFAMGCPDLFERVDRYAKMCSEDMDNKVDYSKSDFFQKLCTFLEFIELREYGGGERWSDAGSREKLGLRFYLAKTIMERTPPAWEIPNLYIKFAEQLREMDTIVSFNWDCLLELAILEVGKTYSYNLADRGAIRLAKMHGSVNWRLSDPNDLMKPVNTLEWKPLEFSTKDGGMLVTDIFHSSRLLDYSIWNSYQPLGEVEPFLILPGYGKAFDVRSNATLWYKPELAYMFVDDIFIIGFGLSCDDFFIRSYFLSNLLPQTDQKIHIINPDYASANNYKFILSKNKNAKLWREAFSLKHVDMMTA